MMNMFIRFDVVICGTVYDNAGNWDHNMHCLAELL